MAELIATERVRVTAVPHQTHLLLHCAPHDAPAIGEQLLLVLSEPMLTSATAGGWSALHLAPDEWLLIGEEDGAAALAAGFADAGGRWPLSLVDISDRSLAYEVTGPGVERVLAAGCPLDLGAAAFPVGHCTRTLFGKAMVMLWRTAPDTFRLEVARSYAPYVLALLELASGERD